MKNSAALVIIGEGRRGNLLSIRVLEELHSTVARLSSDENLRACIFLGKGERFFVAGADIAELSGLNGDGALQFSRLGQSLFARMEKMPQVVIAGVNGYCMGGGMDLLLACDIRIATREAVFAHPGARMGIITGFGGTARFPAAVGRARARALLFAADKIDAREAFRIGLINEVVSKDHLHSHCLAVASRVAEMPPAVIHSWKSGVSAPSKR